MLWIAEDEGLIPPHFAADPLRPPDLLDSEREEVVAAARSARDLAAAVGSPQHRRYTARAE
jgi:hypothetical protein